MTAPRNRTTSIDDALQHIAAETLIWVRLAAAKGNEGNLYARLLELTSGEIPPSWEERHWEYPEAILSALRMPGPDVVNALSNRSIDAGQHHVSLPDLTSMATWDRRQSRSPAAYEALDWPVTETTLSMNTANTVEPQGPLLAGADIPSFLSFYAAAAYFFWLDRQPAGGSLHQGVMYRHQDVRGRINAVRISSDAVEVEVAGRDLDGLMVEMPGDEPGPSERIYQRCGQDPVNVGFAFKEGLPSGTWVLLRKGDEWIDRRFLSVPYARGNEAGVEIIVDPLSRLEGLVGSRERQHVEFKVQLPKDDESKFKVMKTVCAFANGEGGSLLVGVDDDRNIIGVPEPSVDRMRDQLTQMVGSWVEPRPTGNMEALPISDSDRVVLEYVVDAGTELYGCGRPGEARTPYVRHHGITEKATVAEISAIVRSRTPGAPTGPYFLR